LPAVVGRAGGIFADPMDSPALFVITASKYLEHTGDIAFARAFEPTMDRAIAWLTRQDRAGDGLVGSYSLADWMDSILKVGKIFNLNVIYLAGLRACEVIKRSLGADDGADRWRGLPAVTLERLHSVFWNGEYFSDWMNRGRRGGFSSDGNVLAVLWDVATPAEARRILEFVAAHGLQAATPARRCHPVYPAWRVFPLYDLAGFPDYHRTLIWPWLGTLLALREARDEDRTGTRADLSLLADWYVRGNSISEVYARAGVHRSVRSAAQGCRLRGTPGRTCSPSTSWAWRRSTPPGLPSPFRAGGPVL